MRIADPQSFLDRIEAAPSTGAAQVDRALYVPRIPPLLTVIAPDRLVCWIPDDWNRGVARVQAAQEPGGPAETLPGPGCTDTGLRLAGSHPYLVYELFILARASMRIVRGTEADFAGVDTWPPAAEGAERHG